MEHAADINRGPTMRWHIEMFYVTQTIVDRMDTSDTMVFPALSGRRSATREATGISGPRVNLQYVLCRKS